MTHSHCRKAKRAKPAAARRRREFPFGGARFGIAPPPPLPPLYALSALEKIVEADLEAQRRAFEQWQEIQEELEAELLSGE